MDIENIKLLLENFAKERDWEQFHSPKNLAMALSGEAGELIEIFQWLSEEQSYRVMDSEDTAKRVKEELADVFLYLIRMASILNIDLISVALDKIKVNGQKYPIESSKGISTKYNLKNQ